MKERGHRWNEETYLARNANSGCLPPPLHLREHLRKRSPESPSQSVGQDYRGSPLRQEALLPMSSSPCTILTGRQHVARQGGDPLQPSTHRREALQVVAALRTETRVHIEGHVRDRGAIPNEIFAVA